MKKLIVSESAGFCFGVSRSVRLAERALAAGGKPCWSLGELIHNNAAVGELRKKGLSVARTAAEVPEGARVVIRSHGVPTGEYDALRARGCEIVDATCPKVLNTRRILEAAEAAGRVPVIIGMREHPEIQ
ncbi:MAG: bifunctional 4-hydroxy-3-methylbut-2-enyl diphosphate reductase/30S ribosomal protein S1, partial [Oscillospiraceae bacterium]|nr:bifunctional 4-hydroxy-3-methylbut-2-enyl diphosphate reductase/30S ribosomal protein S1 [Oscillospiraceae bacterium]